MDHPMMREAFQVAEQSYKNAWAMTNPNEKELREHLYAQMQGLADVRSHLSRVIDSGVREEQIRDSASLSLAVNNQNKSPTSE